MDGKKWHRSLPPFPLPEFPVHREAPPELGTQFEIMIMINSNLGILDLPYYRDYL